MTRQTVGIFIFDDVEVLDFAGPFEVFSRTRLVPGAESRRSDDSAPFTVFTVARNCRRSQRARCRVGRPYGLEDKVADRNNVLHRSH